MLLQKFDFDNPEAVKSFKLKTKKHKETIEEYYDSYCYAVYKIIEKGLQRNYALNCRAKGLLFLIRHSLELCLKLNLIKIEGGHPITHDLQELIDAFGDKSIIPKGLSLIINKLNSNFDGTCFRYAHDENQKPFYRPGDQLDLNEILKLYNSLEKSGDFIVKEIAPIYNYDDRRLSWDLIFHLGEASQLGTIRTQYDECIVFLIEGILLHGYDVDRLYIPLIFLIRHSLELALKENIYEVQRSSSLIKPKDYSKEHSLVTLFNCYHDFLQKIDPTELDFDTKKQLDEYLFHYEKLNRTIHDLDSNSQKFRFPTDKNNDPYTIPVSKIDLIEIMKVYYYTDPFITFTNYVLEEQGIIYSSEYSED